MTFSIHAQIISSLDLINTQIKRSPPEAIVSPSQVSPQNPHRELLEAIRSDLMHYDSKEKHHRIVFSIQEYLSQHPGEDIELTQVLQRVLEIVERFQKSNQIVFSPEKQQEPTFHKLEDGEALRKKSRELFRSFNEQS